MTEARTSARPMTPDPGGALSIAAALGPSQPPQLVREQAFETVKDAIISGRLPPGVRLIERELCEALGVSRTIVREALRRLEAERLVTVTAHRGPRVAELTAKTAHEIYELRVELEVLLVRGFARNAPDAALTELQALTGEVQAAARRQDVVGLVAIMRRFYAVLTAGADNATAADILETLHARISRLRVLAMAQPGRIERSVGEITDIVEALVRRDVAGAEHATRRYVGAARDAALNQLERERL